MAENLRPNGNVPNIHKELNFFVVAFGGFDRGVLPTSRKCLAAGQRARAR